MTTVITPPRGGKPREGFFKRMLRQLRVTDSDTATAVEAMLQAGEDRGVSIESAQRVMIMNAARFDRLRVADVMTPRADIVALDAASTLAEAAAMFAESQHSRLPVYRDTLDDPLGFVHVKDVLALLAPGPEGETKGRPSERVLPRVKREILFVPSSMRLPSLLLKMQTSRIHLALVVDEYGGTDGLVSIEDVVEQIVGEIADEHDVDTSDFVQLASGVIEADGRTDVSKLEAKLGVSLALPDDDAEYDTVGGLASAIVGRVPQRGELLRHPAGFDFEVLDADPRRVRRLRILSVAPPAAEENAA